MPLSDRTEHSRRIGFQRSTGGLAVFPAFPRPRETPFPFRVFAVSSEGQRRSYPGPRRFNRVRKRSPTRARERLASSYAAERRRRSTRSCLSCLALVSLSPSPLAIVSPRRSNDESRPLARSSRGRLNRVIKRKLIRVARATEARLRRVNKRGLRWHEMGIERGGGEGLKEG